MIVLQRFALLFAIGFMSVSAHADDSSFDFYLDEFSNHSLPMTDPMVDLIELRLVEALFESASDSEFRARLQLVHDRASEDPELQPRLRRLDRKLRDTYEEKLKAAKTYKLYYSLAGTLTGALIGWPIGKALGGGKWIAMAIPAGALIGGGSGYLLGHLLYTPAFAYERELVTLDSKHLDDQMNELLRD